MSDLDIATLAHKFALWSSAGSVVAWLMSSQAISFWALILGAVSLGVNWHFKRRQDRREQAEYEARMRKMETRPGALQ